jgi:penicillin-binding protein 2
LIPIAAPRGFMYDRNGKIVVRSRPSYVCALIPSEVADLDRTLEQLAQTLGLDAAALRKRVFHHHGVNYESFDQVVTFEPYGPIILASDLSTAQMARLVESLGEMPGVDLEAQPVRDYPHQAEGSHVFGYVGAISESEYDEKKKLGYSPNDVVGKDGLEYEYDRYLRGKIGGEQIEVNAEGRLVRRLPKPVDPVPGDSLVLTLDWRLQHIVERALKDQIDRWSVTSGRRLSGAAVVLDPRSGGVLALASAPNFNPNDFVNGIKPEIYSRYLTDPLQPLYNRGIGMATPTGSTFKMITGSGAISAGVIEKHQIHFDSGSYYCHGVTFTDIAAGGFGTIDFETAIAGSSDGYFYWVADRLGHEKLRFYATQYGLGSKLGIDIPGEYPGNWPTNEWSMKVYNLPLEPSDVCILGIGQGAMQATPLQMADVTATVANGGTLYRPHFVTAVRDPQGRTIREFKNEVIRKVPVTQEALREVRTGMARVTQPGGTAYGLAIDGLPFSGKTGTVETEGGNGPNTTWFVAFAPTDHPVMALAICIEKSGQYGATVAAPIAQRIFADYFGKKLPE